MFSSGNLYEFQEVCTGMEVRAASVIAMAFVPHGSLPDPFPTFNVASAAEALSSDDFSHPIFRCWFSDAEAMLRGAEQQLDEVEVLACLRGERPLVTAKYRVYFLVEPAPRVWHWLPVALRQDGKRAVEEVKIIT